MDISNLSEEQIRLIEDLNIKINSMVPYGVKDYTTKKNGRIAMWSNRTKNWGLFFDLTPKGTTIKLDANMFFIENEDYTLVISVIPYLSYLLLYYNSFEAKCGM